jgi:hypothetical protein
LATELFLEHPTFGKMKSGYEGDKDVRERFHTLSDGKEFGIATKDLTIVEKIIVPRPTREFSVHRNVIEIPHVGKLFLGELTIQPDSKSLSMMRWELGCPSGGDGSGGGGTGGGSVP